MSRAAVLVKVMLGETGEADQDYDHATFDSIVDQLAKAGYPGARHREFDKYQGVYLVVPGVDKFWSSYGGGGGLDLIPEDDPFKQAEDEVTEIPVEMSFGGSPAGIEHLLQYINDRYRAKFAHAQAQSDAEDFIDATLAGKRPRRKPTASPRIPG